MAGPFRQTSRTLFQDFQKALSPTAFLQPNGAAFEAAQGSVKDAVFERCLQAVKAKYPSVAPGDALAAIGADRMMPRGGSESDGAYAARLLNAWNVWPWAGTAYGVLQAFYSTGYQNVVLAQVRGGKQFTLDNGGTNLALWSQAIGQSPWALTNATITSNATAAPDGTTTAVKLVENNAISSQHRLDWQSTLASGFGLFSIWAKAAERTKICLRLAGSSTGYSMDLSNGTFTSPGGGFIVGMLADMAGWYRCFICGPSVGSDFVRVNLEDASGSINYSAVGTNGAYLYGPQVEQVSSALALPSAYSPTYGVAKSTALPAGSLLTSTGGTWCPTYVGDPFWSRFDVLFPLPLMPPSWGWAGGVPSSSSAEAAFIRALVAAWKPAHATTDAIKIITQGNAWGYPASMVWGATTGVWGGTGVIWTP